MLFVDPLLGYADPRLYVPLGTGERALAAIGASLGAGRAPVLLTGPRGIGKTLLLRVLAEREWRLFQRVRFSPWLSVEPDELASCLLHLLFGKRFPDDREAEVALLSELRSARDARTLLLVDSIHRTPEASLRKLAELARVVPALVVVAAATNGPELRRLTAALAPEVTVSLPESLPELEIETLYATILANPGLSPRLRFRLASVERAEVTRAAAGIPRLLRSELVRRNEEMSARVRELRPAEKVQREAVRAPAAPVTGRAAERNPDRARRRGRARRLPRPVRVTGPVRVTSGSALAVLVASATLLLAAALFSFREYETHAQASPALLSPAFEHLEAVTPKDGLLAPDARGTSDTPTSHPLNVQVDARPRARARLR